MTKIFLRWLLVLMLLPGIVQAQALPSSAMQRAIGAVLEKKMAARGFASNDPRWSATLQSSGSAAAGQLAAAAAVAAAGVTAPAWVTLAATVALGSILAYGIDLAVDGIRWAIKGDGSVTYTPTGGGSSAPPEAGGAMTAGGAYYQAGDVYGGSGANVAKEYVTLNFSGRTFGAGFYDNSGNYIYYIDDPQSGEGHCAPYPHCRQEIVMKQSAGAPTNCAGGMVFAGTCRALTPTGSDGPPAQITTSPTEAFAALTDADKAKPANPELIAKIADALWAKAASLPGYAGVPYDASSPITTADASAVQQSNPGSWPTVGDVTSPQQASPGQPAAAPWTPPNSAAEPVVNPGTTPAQPTPSNGLDWAIPGTNESVEKKAFQINYTPVAFKAATGCPAAIEYRMFDTTYQLSYGPLCDLMQYLYPLFLTFGAISAAFIFAAALKS